MPKSHFLVKFASAENTAFSVSRRNMMCLVFKQGLELTETV